MDPLVISDWQSRVRYGEEGPQPQILSDDGQVRLILGGLRAGQKIPVHAEEKAIYLFLEGNGQMTVDAQTFPVSQGMTVIVPEGAKRGIAADTQTVFLAVRIS